MNTRAEWAEAEELLRLSEHALERLEVRVGGVGGGGVVLGAATRHPVPVCSAITTPPHLPAAGGHALSPPSHRAPVPGRAAQRPHGACALGPCPHSARCVHAYRHCCWHGASLSARLAFLIPQLPSLAELPLGGESEDEHTLDAMLLSDMQLWPASVAMPPTCTPLPLEHTPLAFSPPPAPLDLHLAPLLPPPCEAAFHPGCASPSQRATHQRAAMHRTPPKRAASSGSSVSTGVRMQAPHALMGAATLYPPAATAARPASHLPTITTGDRWMPSNAAQLRKRARC